MNRTVETERPDSVNPNRVTHAALEEARKLQQACDDGVLIPELVDLTSVESMLRSFGVEGGRSPEIEEEQ